MTYGEIAKMVIDNPRLADEDVAVYDLHTGNIFDADCIEFTNKKAPAGVVTDDGLFFLSISSANAP